MTNYSPYHYLGAFQALLEMFMHDVKDLTVDDEIVRELAIERLQMVSKHADEVIREYKEI